MALSPLPPFLVRTAGAVSSVGEPASSATPRPTQVSILVDKQLKGTGVRRNAGEHGRNFRFFDIFDTGTDPSYFFSHGIQGKLRFK